MSVQIQLFAYVLFRTFHGICLNGFRWLPQNRYKYKNKRNCNFPKRCNFMNNKRTLSTDRDMRRYLGMRQEISALTSAEPGEARGKSVSLQSETIPEEWHSLIQRTAEPTDDRFPLWDFSTFRFLCCGFASVQSNLITPRSTSYPKSFNRI